MARILVAGLVNIETTVKVTGFPLTYTPVNFPFFGIDTTVSGVGYNIAKALTTLGNQVIFLSLIGKDIYGTVVHQHLEALGIDTRYVLQTLDSTAQSAILYDDDGQRMIHTDLKDIQEQTYPTALFHQSAIGCELAVLCNINFTRSLLDEAHHLNLPVATDIHTISALSDEYNRDYMRGADILFMSHENLPMSPQDWIKALRTTYTPQIIVIGLGGAGALLSEQSTSTVQHINTQVVRPIINTIGGGDALFSSFIHGYLQTDDAHLALQKATLFASYKIGATGAAEGFLTAKQLDNLYHQYYR